MDTFEWLDIFIHLTVLTLIGVHVVGVGITSWRSRRAGKSATLVGAETTTSLIGLGLALSCSAIGGYIAYLILVPLEVPVLAMVAVQLGIAFLASFRAARLYERYLARLIFRWFIGEEVTENG